MTRSAVPRLPMTMAKHGVTGHAMLNSILRPLTLSRVNATRRNSTSGPPSTSVLPAESSALPHAQNSMELIRNSRQVPFQISAAINGVGNNRVKNLRRGQSDRIVQAEPGEQCGPQRPVGTPLRASD